ncbi:hypothetical protein SAMN02745130_01892 [Thiothrix eikelboomii]|uniref:Cellulose-binding domain-containing protein n=1 Tax=Thiothrix eikelboomii TaxID=92487 RepID=A0A1T4WML0_9GAMM|nr:hypothetical protein [Thiothrix eikelboomii]SKA78574.1 hypothetical protein SAMN02745130_01892 [Thiothrix eikelboomii]
MSLLLKHMGLGVATICVALVAPFAMANNQSSPLATNTNELTEDDASVPFIDLFRAALPFEDARPWLTGANVQLDANGWPARLNGQIAGTRFLSNLPAQALPGGRYTVLYEGQGKLQYGGDAKLVAAGQGQDTIDLFAGSDNKFDATLRILESNPNNYVRNIRILPPDGICANNPFKRVPNAGACRGNYQPFVQNYEQQIFNPDYLDYMKDFKSIRFMNMSGISNNPQSSWNQRQKLTDATWGGSQTNRGAPIEIQIELANRLNAHPWFTLHHAADNNYVMQFAQLVKQRLRPNLKPHVEYSNETWNFIFLQGNYVRDMGMARRLDTNKNRAGYRYYSERSVEIFRIWEQVFGGSQRLVRILSGWTINEEVAETVLGHKDAYKSADAFAIAPYFFGDHQSIQLVRNLDETFKLMTDDQYRYSINNVLAFIRKQKAIANKYGLQLMAYEGGQGLVDFKTTHDLQMPNPLLYQANRHPRMGSLYTQFLEGWKREGGSLFAHYSSPRTYRRYGSWGSKEYITQPLGQAYKHQALLNFIRSRPCWWAGCQQ